MTAARGAIIGMILGLFATLVVGCILHPPGKRNSNTQLFSLMTVIAGVLFIFKGGMAGVIGGIIYGLVALIFHIN